MSDKTLPRDITSYDLLKLFAVLTMVIDHFGVYFFPDELWWRVIGRLSFPVWLFLVGYARSRDISPRLMIGAGIVFVSNIFAGMGIIPLSILVTIIVVRLGLDRLMKILSKSPVHLWAGSAALLILALPSYIVMEFGLQAFIFAGFGYLARRREDEGRVFQYAVFACLGYVFLQSFSYGLFGMKFVVLAAGMALVSAALYKFEPKTYPEMTKDMSAAGRWFVQFCGRRTLEIYVGHLVLFKTIAVLAGVEGYEFMNWGWVW